MRAADRTANRITAASIAISVLLVAPLFIAYRLLDSKLALAQAADSFTDSFTAAALLYSLRVGAAPADPEHPRGHGRAEPIAALVAAVLAGVVALEVIREALSALVVGAAPRMAWPLMAILVVKVAAKAWIAVQSGRHHRHTGGPAMRALQVDARNDVLVGLVTIAGFFATRYGSHGWDAWLALPVGAWIAVAGTSLALENIRLLMGEAPSPERQAQLMAIAGEVDGVESLHELTARFDGTQLDVSLHIVVDERLSLRAAHDIAESVEARLMRESDILHAMVHVDVEPDEHRTDRPT